MKVKEIVKAYLEKNGFDGLYNDNCCACKLDDLMPCSDTSPECQAGWFCDPDPEYSEEADFYIGPKRME